MIVSCRFQFPGCDSDQAAGRGARSSSWGHEIKACEAFGKASKDRAQAQFPIEVLSDERPVELGDACQPGSRLRCGVALDDSKMSSHLSR